MTAGWGLPPPARRPSSPAPRNPRWVPSRPPPSGARRCGQGKAALAARTEGLACVPVGAWEPPWLPLLALPSPGAPQGQAAGALFRHGLPGGAGSSAPAGLEMSGLPPCVQPPLATKTFRRGLPGCRETCHPGSMTSLCQLLHCPCCLSFGTYFFFKTYKDNLFLTAHNSRWGLIALHPCGCRKHGVYLKELSDINKMPSSSIFHTRKGFDFALSLLTV